jgi:uncharacterized membrane protein YfhO
MPPGREDPRQDRGAFWVPLLVGVAFLACAVYAPYIFGNRVFLFSRVGSDTYYQYWPFDRYLGELLRGGHFPAWTFRIGLGQEILTWPSNLNPFALFVRMLPPSLQPGGYVFKMILECVCATWLWRRYLLSLGAGRLAAVLAPLLYGFNGYLTLWGQHSAFGVVFSLVPLTLWAYEHLLRRGRWWPLVLCLSAFQVISFYFFVMFAVFFAVFAVTRAAAVMGPEARGLVRNQIRLAVCLLVSLALAAWAVLPMLAYFRTSPRAGPASVGVLSLFPLAQYAGLLRIYSNNVFGTDIWFRGPMNYYELPQLACGMLPLLLLPQFFRIAGRRERWWAGAALALVALSLLSPYVAHVFVGLTAPTFRQSFLWIVLCLFLAARVIHAIEKGEQLHRGLLTGTAVLLSLPALVVALAAAGIRHGLIVVPSGLAARGLAMMRALRPQSTAADFSFTLKEELAPDLMAQLGVALAAIGAYTALLLLFRKRPRIAGGALLAVVIAEIFLLTWPTVNHRVTLSKADLRRAEGYFDATGEALQAIRAADASWFRVDKTYRSVFLNDPLFQGYFGTSGYTSISEPSTLAILRALEVPTFEDRGPNYVAGFGGRELLNALVGVKYLLAKEPLERPGYRPFGSAKDVRIYVNERALPLGFVQRRTVDPAAFAALPTRRRDLALLEGFVPGESLQAEPTLLARHTAGHVDLKTSALDGAALDQRFNDAVESLRHEPFEISSFREDRIGGQVTLREDGVLILSIPFNRGWQATVDGRDARLHRIDAGFIGLPLAAGTRVVELRFVPEGSGLGRAVSLLTAIGCFLWLVFARRRAFQRPGELSRG